MNSSTRFERIQPDHSLQQIIECYWIAENENPLKKQQKIIPDGFTEVIFHLADPYRICIDGTWQLQSRTLVAGQISKHFLLENTGVSSMIAVKFKPTALTHLYKLPMNDMTDRVLDATATLGSGFARMEKGLRSCDSRTSQISSLNDYFLQLLKDKGPIGNSASLAVDQLCQHHGMLSISDICKTVGVGERQMENLFKHHVGLSPKLFARILRFNYLFQLLEENNHSWTDLAYEAAYYDQSHFIRNFKTFTGESPGKYSFDEKNMANFFLKKR